MTVSEHGKPALEINDLVVAIDRSSGPLIVVDGVSLSVPRGKTVALVGESGCGKSMTALSILRLIAPPVKIVGGSVTLCCELDESTALLSLSERRMREIRGNRIAMIFQEPMTALNPVYTIGDQIVEAIQLHRNVRIREARSMALELLRRVSFPEPQRVASEYPHRLSGGMRQRAMIAMALSCGPDVLIADEPTTALDATTQREILDLLRSLQQAEDMGILLITHDLGVVAMVADYVYVMYAGQIVEHAPAASLLRNPLHPYTQGLIDCTPRLGQPKRRLNTIPGAVPDPAHWPTGCRFHTRCHLSAALAGQCSESGISAQTTDGIAALSRCVIGDEKNGMPDPPLREQRPDHFVACWEVEGGIGGHVAFRSNSSIALHAGR